MIFSSSNPILEVCQLTTQLKVGRAHYTIVDHLNFSLYSGKTLALVGESGCGKSLTALSIMRILPSPPAFSSQGQILYKNQNLLTLREKEMRRIRGSKIAMIFQDPVSALNPVYTIENQLVEVAELHLGIYGEEAYYRAVDTLKAVGIQDAEQKLASYPHQLSGGLKQRVMIAMALMCEPDILIADEPTTALDVTIQAQVLELIRSLQQKNQMALLLITHDMGVVAEMADEVIVMYMAQAVEQGSAQALFRSPSHPYTNGLFKSRPLMNKTQTKLCPIPGQVPSFTHTPKGCRFHPRCSYTMEKCKQGLISCYSTSVSSHYAKCLLYDQTEESGTKLRLLKEETFN